MEKERNKELLNILMDTYYPGWFKQIWGFIRRHGGDNKSAKDIFASAQIEPSDLMGVAYLQDTPVESKEGNEVMRGLVKHVTPDPLHFLPRE